MAEFWNTGISTAQLGAIGNFGSGVNGAALVAAKNATAGTSIFYQSDAVTNQTQLSIAGTNGRFTANISGVTVSKPTEYTQTDVVNNFYNTFNKSYNNGTLASASEIHSQNSSTGFKVLFSTEALIGMAEKGNSAIVNGVLSRMPISSINNNLLNVNAGYYNNKTNITNNVTNTYNNTYNNKYTNVVQTYSTVYRGYWW